MKRQIQAAFTVGVLSTFIPALARAQDAEVDPKAPNVLLLVDTSGSMEYMVGVDSVTQKPVYPTCTPTGTGTQRSRWIDLLEVLGGTIQNYHCQQIDRSSSSFKTEYSLQPTNLTPIDYEYRNYYHRPMSGECVYGPDMAANPTNAFSWVDPKQHKYNDTAGSCTSPFLQDGDGILTTFGSVARFGLMTFDTLPDANTGVSGTSPSVANGLLGAWSYYVGSPHVGRPVDCSTLPDMEVGARNAAALPWEGKMIPFGARDLTSTEDQQRHDRIRQVLLTTRPYGATPLAGMLDDAREFLLNDATNDAAKYIAPKFDSFVQDKCREQVVIVLTDGEPNLDLRDECAVKTGTYPGMCPYETPETTVRELYNDGIKTYVIGFSPIDIGSTAIKCNDISWADVNSGTGKCDVPGTTDPEALRELEACCNMHRIAYEGSNYTQGALIAENRSDLRTALNTILNQIITAEVHSRTRPTWARAGLADSGIANYMGTAPASSFRFLTGIEPSRSEGWLWKGQLLRQRFSCSTTTSTPEAKDVEELKGDDFIANVNKGGPSQRNYYTYVSTDVGYNSIRTIRPSITSTDPDGLGKHSGSQVSGNGSSFPGQVPSSTMAVDETQSNCAGLTNAQCATRVLKWTIGVDDGDSNSTNRCDSAATCSLIADIFHSTPRVVERPDANIQDETYTTFAASKATRPQVLYVSSNDGFLHAFKVRPNGATSDPPVDSNSVQNELWAYIPPAVLTRFQSQFRGNHQRLLDGEPVVKDVVATNDGAGNLKFERSTGSAQVGGGSVNNTWRTVLVQSFGGAWSGYFALDVTDPVPGTGTGPKLLWQLTTAEDGSPLFGTGGMPLITTVFDGTKEIAVAVLPGGSGGSPTGMMADRYSVPPYTQIPNATYTPRSKVNAYPVTSTAARSVTIVRLDNGQILRTFRQDKDAIPNALGTAGLNSEKTAFAGVTTAKPELDSPITGRPVAFPSDVGAVADRVFVGDQDGTMWRIDVSEQNPANWKMDLFFDAYGIEGSTAGLIGQPIDTPPILSVDELGNITVNFSTGDQESIDSGSTTNYVYSLTEKLASDGSFKTQVNWYEKFTDGKRITGPMVLLQGDLYFSTFTPKAGTTCGGGTSEITAYNYKLPFNTNQPDEGKGGQRVKNQDGTGDFLIPNIEGTVFGVTVGQQPSCNSAGASDTTSSPYLGGYSKASSTVQPGGLQLMYHTTDSGKKDSNTGKVGAATSAVRLPPNVSRISSWAALVD
jgi:type IV pilus assembly protein PilY1